MDFGHLGMEREANECVESSAAKVFYRFHALQGEVPEAAVEPYSFALRANRHQNANPDNYYSSKRRLLGASPTDC